MRVAGVAGLAFATSLGAAAHFCGVLLALERKLNRAPYHTSIRPLSVIGTLLRTATACVPMAVVGLLAARFAPFPGTASKVGELVKVLWVAGLAGVAFMLAANFLRIPEWKWIASRGARSMR